MDRPAVPSSVGEIHVALLRLAHNRDAEAWAFLLNEFGEDIERLAARLTGDRTLAEDAVQETLLQVRDYAGRFRSPAANPEKAARRWILGIAANVCFTLLRTRRRARAREEAARKAVKTSERPGEAMERAEMSDALRHALADLPHRHRVAIMLHHVVGLGFPEVAAELSCPLSTAKSHVQRGLERMRKHLRRVGVSLSVAALVGGLRDLPAATVAMSSQAASALLSAPITPRSIPAAKTFLGGSIFMKCSIAAAIILVTVTATYLAGAQGADKVSDKGGAKRTGPLADLPSKPGPHIDKIKALGDNEWINIGRAAPDPKYGEGSIRSWGSKWPYAPELGGAFVSGQGAHGAIKANGYYDDVFFYDLNAHRWICLYPGIQTKTFANDVKTGKIKVGEKGWLVDQDGQPVHAYGMHNYQNGAYDSDTHTYTTLGWPDGAGGDGNWQSPGHEWYAEVKPLLEAQAAASPGYKSRSDRWLPFRYDTTTGTWSREGPYGHFYIPSKKDFFIYWNNQTIFYSKHGPVEPKGPRPWMVAPTFSDYGACFDSKRDRIYTTSKGSDEHPDQPCFFVYEIATNTWTVETIKEKVDFMPTGTHTAMIQYNSVSDRVVLIYNNGEGKTGVAAWDPETHVWESVGQLPQEVINVGMMAGFFCPELNAHFALVARDSSPGDWWVYRYKKAVAKKSDKPAKKP